MNSGVGAVSDSFAAAGEPRKPGVRSRGNRAAKLLGSTAKGPGMVFFWSRRMESLASGGFVEANERRGFYPMAREGFICR